MGLQEPDPGPLLALPSPLKSLRLSVTHSEKQKNKRLSLDLCLAPSPRPLLGTAPTVSPPCPVTSRGRPFLGPGSPHPLGGFLKAPEGCIAVLRSMPRREMRLLGDFTPDGLHLFFFCSGACGNFTARVGARAPCIGGVKS